MNALTCYRIKELITIKKINSVENLNAWKTETLDWTYFLYNFLFQIKNGAWKWKSDILIINAMAYTL